MQVANSEETKAPASAGGQRALLLLAVSALILGLAPLAALGAARVYTWVSGAAEAGVMRPGVLAERQALQAVVYFAALHGSIAALSLLAARLLRRRTGEVLRLGPPIGGRRQYLWGALATLGLSAVWLALLLLVSPDAVLAEIGDFPRLVRTGWGLLLLPVLALLAPVAEELMFRGWLFEALSATPAGRAGGAVLSSLVWAGLHVDHSLLSRAQLFVAGLALAFVVIRWGSLRLAIWCHVVFNVALSVLLIASGAGL